MKAVRCGCLFSVIERREDEEERQLLKEINDEFTGNRLIVEDVFGWIKDRARAGSGVWTSERAAG